LFRVCIWACMADSFMARRSVGSMAAEDNSSLAAKSHVS
jgi:hypothetical protein